MEEGVPIDINRTVMNSELCGRDKKCIQNFSRKS
jgi:hypothetical protein